MSEVKEIKKARQNLKKTLRALVESDDNLLGALLVDSRPGMSAGMPLSSYIRDEESKVGPSGGRKDILGGTILEARDKIKRLSDKDRLNLGDLKRSMIEGKNGLSILIPLPEAEAILLIWGGKKTNVGFVYTVLRNLAEKISDLTMKAA
ncbi:MAG: hypothetical protein GWO20_02090 [Candidatus Korarchaeota archaeon]|nr:hypothetical protein [Candidatus Korarchaeota archaeon]NIU84624.1 hypothetical protein [Candidatus Thorarchaeota archaeon]NIW12766.1 hypothetical protein [Candidatus Thorarchaeota archaeon]NIW50973.1 hypothetical protein [Candidatus Korarchaeota archaeon]